MDTLTASVMPLKEWAITFGIGIAMRFVLQAVKKYVPSLWAKVPAKIQPYVSTLLGAIVAALGDPSQIVQAAASGAAGGAVGKISYDKSKAAKEEVVE